MLARLLTPRAHGPLRALSPTIPACAMATHAPIVRFYAPVVMGQESRSRREASRLSARARRIAPVTVTRILAVPDPSGRAVTWAREAASRFEAELDALALDPDEADPAGAVVREAAHRACDLIVLSDAGMRDRTEFLLANVANRVSHAARCSVVFVSDVDTELRPVELIGSFIARTLTRDLARHGDPRVALYELQKLRVRSRRLFEGLERITGARPGPRLQSRGAGPRWSSSAPCNA
jgi:nucleotide-binding universal stress UspA family protein